MGKAEQRQKDKARALAKADERRRVVLRVYQGCDERGGARLAALAEGGVTPSCREGCAHCCNLEIPISRAEGEALVAWLSEHVPTRLHAIRDRLRGWLTWYRTDYPRLVAAGMERTEIFFRHGPPCALLEGHRCSAYAVRPITCRTHLVTSPVEVCDPAVGTGDVDMLLDVAVATRDHVAELRHVIEQQGGSYLASIHLLPEWLAHLLEVELEPWRGAPALDLGA